MTISGVVRKVDDLGRVVLPGSVRKILNIQPRDSFEIYLEDDCVVLRRYEPTCAFCDSTTDIVNYKGCKICKNCLKKLNVEVNE